MLDFLPGVCRECVGDLLVLCKYLVDRSTGKKVYNMKCVGHLLVLCKYLVDRSTGKKVYNMKYLKVLLQIIHFLKGKTANKLIKTICNENELEAIQIVSFVIYFV